MPFTARLAAGSAVTTVALLCACAPPAPAPNAASPAPPTGDDALAFLNDVERQYTALGEESSRINWVNATYINFDTNWLVANIDARATELRVRYAKEAVRFDDAVVPPDARRKLDLLKLNLTLP